MDRPAPVVVILAGPNGAGKSTSAPYLLRDAVGIENFVNADTIAAGLSAFEPAKVALTAGKLMLQRTRQLAALRASFAFETTLASRSFAPWLRELRSQGYKVELVFLALPSADAAVERVAERARRGGHDVPEADIRRRYAAGLRNFFNLYQPLLDLWRVYNSLQSGEPVLVARNGLGQPLEVYDNDFWRRIKAHA